MENITLYEAMEYIYQYITERAPRGAVKKYADIIAKKDDEFIDKEEDLINKKKQLRKIAEYNPKANDLIAKTKDELEKVKAQDAANRRKFSDNAGVNLDSFYGALHRANKSDAIIKRAKQNFGQGQDPRSKLEKKPAGLYATKESVETKLHVYEAFDAGIITEEEKNDLLNVLESFNE